MTEFTEFIVFIVFIIFTVTLNLENREWVHVQSRYILLTCHISIGGLVAIA